MRFFLFLSLFSTLLTANEAGELDDLLSRYREANELYHQTKENSSGHVIVFSRADLDKMQAYTLNDILKTIRMFTLKTTRFGGDALVKSPYSTATMPSIKLFINSYQLTSVTTATGLTQFGKMGLNFVDHIEIYQASNAVAFNGEPGNMVIKLYTKDPARENATILQATLDSRSSARTQIVDVGKFEDYSYLINADLSKNSYKEYKNAASKLSRDGHRGQLYFNLSKKEDFSLEVGSAIEKYDILSGFGSAVSDGSMDTCYHYAQFTKYFDNEIKMMLSSSYESIRIHNSDSAGFSLFDATPTHSLSAKTGSYVHSGVLEKNYTYKNHALTFGLQTKLKRFYLDSFQSQGYDKPIALGPKTLDIYMGYFEDRYTIDEDYTLVLSAKLDYYKNRVASSSSENIYRLAYLGRINNAFKLRSFIQRGYVYPVFAQTTFSPLYDPNPYLESAKTNIAKIEIEYNRKNLSVIAGSGGSRSKNGIVFDASKNSYVNNERSSDFWHYFINVNYKFDADDKIRVELFKAYKENFNFSSDTGLLVQLYNRLGAVDLYNELVYRSDYRGIDGVYIHDGYDYTCGATYDYDKRLALKLKGENLFNKAIRSSIGGITMPSLERRVLFTMEYTF